MKVISRKIYLVAVLAVMAIVAFWLGISMQIKPAVATSTSLLPEGIEVVNIEDVVDDVTTDVNFYSRSEGTSGSFTVYSSSKQNDVVNKVSTVTGSGSVDIGLFTRKATATDVDAGGYKTNTSAYDNNLSVYTSDSQYAHVKLKIHEGSAVESIRNTLVRVRMSYDADRRFVMGTRNGTSGWCCSTGGAKFVFNTSSDNMLTIGSGTAISEVTLLSAVNGATGTRDSLFTEGDSLIFTFGGYDVTVDDVTKTVLYFSVYNDTQKYLAIEQNATVGSLALSNGYVSFEVKGDGLSRHDALTIEGVNEPIFLNSSASGAGDINISAGEYAIGTPVKDIVLPEGYTLLDNSGVLQGGLNVLRAAVAPEGYPAPYYGQYGTETTVKVYALNTTNLEDVIDSVNDITYKTNGGKVLYDGATGTGYENGEINKINTYNEDIQFPVNPTTYNVKWALYTTKGTGETTDIAYWKRTSDGVLVEENIEYNVNDYDGNLSFMNDSFYESDLWFNKNKLDKNSIISFSFNYEGNAMAFAARSSAIQDEIWNSGYSFYKIKLGNTSNTPNVTMSVGNTNVTDINGVEASWKEETLLSEASAINGKTISTLYEKGDILTVTYGVYDSVDGENKYDNIYFYVYNQTKGHIVCEKLVTVTANENITGKNMGLSFHWSHTSVYYVYNRNAVTIAGINEPLITDSYGAEVTGNYKEDDAITSVVIPEGYTFNDDASKLLVAGENKIKVKTTIAEYYGVNNPEIGTFITVNAESLPSYNVFIKDLADAQVDAYTIKHGKELTLPELSGRAKDFVAYKYDGKLYNAGEKIEVTGSMTISLVEIDFAMATPEIRLVKDVNGNGGLRFIAEFDATDYANVSELGVTFKSIIVPAKLGENFDPTLESYTQEIKAKIEASTAAISPTVADDGKAYAKFSITDVNKHNFHVNFSGVAIIEVTFASGEKAYVMEQKTACVYDLAVEKYADVDFATSYGEIAKEVISEYVLGVIDLTYAVNGDNVTISMTDNANGLDLGDKAYFASLAENVTVTNGAEITIQINLSEAGVAYVGSLAAETSLPIILRNVNNVNDFKTAISANFTCENSILTVTFGCAI